MEDIFANYLDRFKEIVLPILEKKTLNYVFIVLKLHIDKLAFGFSNRIIFIIFYQHESFRLCL